MNDVVPENVWKHFHHDCYLHENFTSFVLTPYNMSQEEGGGFFFLFCFFFSPAFKSRTWFIFMTMTLCLQTCGNSLGKDLILGSWLGIHKILAMKCIFVENYECIFLFRIIKKNCLRSGSSGRSDIKLVGLKKWPSDHALCWSELLWLKYVIWLYSTLGNRPN